MPVLNPEVLAKGTLQQRGEVDVSGFGGSVEPRGDRQRFLDGFRLHILANERHDRGDEDGALVRFGRDLRQTRRIRDGRFGLLHAVDMQFERLGRHRDGFSVGMRLTDASGQVRKGDSDAPVAGIMQQGGKVITVFQYILSSM